MNTRTQALTDRITATLAVIAATVALTTLLIWPTLPLDAAVKISDEVNYMRCASIDWDAAANNPTPESDACDRRLLYDGTDYEGLV